MVETEEDQSSGRMEEGPARQLIIQNVTEEGDDPSPLSTRQNIFYKCRATRIEGARVQKLVNVNIRCSAIAHICTKVSQTPLI